MIQVYKEAFKARATSLRARRTHFSVKNRDYDSGIIKNIINIKNVEHKTVKSFVVFFNPQKG
jgi:hypothetical protein